MENLDLYKVVYKPEESDGVYAISLVEDPAMEKFFIALSKEQEEVKLAVEGEKRLITGPVLIPNKKILRFDKRSNTEYNMVFEEKEIRLFSQDFMKNDYQHNSTIGHDENAAIQNLTFVESWIIEDSNNDKANALGFKDLPVGTWMASAYVEDNDTWDLIKSKKVRGFSIDSILNMKKIEMSITKKNKEQMNLLKELSRIVGKLTADVNLGSVETPEGTLFSETYSVGETLTLDKNDGNGPMPLANIEIVVEGKSIITDDMGVIISAEPVAVEEVAAEATEEALAEELLSLAEETAAIEEEVAVEAASIEEEIASDAIESIMEDIIESVAEGMPAESIDYKALIENITKQLQDVLNQNVALQAQVEELSKQPAAVKLGANETKTSAKETTMERLSRIVAENKNKK
ncbi:Phage-like element PBSX protein, XkdF [uncultured Caudovirales phage]|uniref:Phage-like element PBSX protein, XkdF n=1 Tax=uncultured Caudovirales phage TaxID=2100421 RepID=A0A6J5N3A9_9CAUD|nr:Phage-like element PBSX protein, XkdF [uncultured Caudovirales phage]